LIRVLSECLRECNWCEGVTIVESMHIPFIRLKCKTALTTSEEVSPLEVVSIDISIEGRRDRSTKNESDGQWDERIRARKYTHSGADAREFWELLFLCEEPGRQKMELLQ
jgi:hypothetical protein